MEEVALMVRERHVPRSQLTVAFCFLFELLLGPTHPSDEILAERWHDAIHVCRIRSNSGRTTMDSPYEQPTRPHYRTASKTYCKHNCTLETHYTRALQERKTSETLRERAKWRCLQKHSLQRLGIRHYPRSGRCNRSRRERCTSQEIATMARSISHASPRPRKTILTPMMLNRNCQTGI